MLTGEQAQAHLRATELARQQDKLGEVSRPIRLLMSMKLTCR